MDRESAIRILRQHEPELKAAGILHLSIFGSVGRNEATDDSDVDLLADFDKSKVTLLTVSGLQIQLADMLGVNVDLSSPAWLKESIREQILSEAAHVF